MAIKTMEQIVAENEMKRMQRQAKLAAQKQYNADVRAKLHDNHIEDMIAWHEDCKIWQMKRAGLTAIIFPGIAASQQYKSYVAHNIAKHDRKNWPGIKTAGNQGDTPYYTNSSHLPVGYTYDIFDALDIQDELQTLYTSGTVFHAFLGEKLPDWKTAADLVRTIAENYNINVVTIWNYVELYCVFCIKIKHLNQNK